MTKSSPEGGSPRDPATGEQAPAGAHNWPPYQASPLGFAWLKAGRDGEIRVRLTNFTATIVADTVRDDGAERVRVYSIEASLNGRTRTIDVPAAQFSSLGWVSEALGAEALVFPGQALRDHTRAAIQLLSGAVPERRIYTHSGWRKIDGQRVYLHGAGAIGPLGPVEGVEVDLASPLDRLALPLKPEAVALHDAVRASLRMLALAPARVAVPLLAAVYRAPLGGADFAVHLAGPTGVGKSELAALGQAHYGAGFDARHLPGSWCSTANALEGQAFAAKDALLVVDDFAPSGSSSDVARTHREADRLIRSAGNQSGRQRMRADTTLRPAKPPRCLIVSTGEDIPRGQSLRARIFVVEVGPDDLDWDALGAAQGDASDGVYAGAIASYIRWLAGADLDKVVRSEKRRLRDAAASSASHRRTPAIIGELALGFGLLLNFAETIGALDSANADSTWETAWEALGEAALEQAGHQAAAEPAARFVQLLSASLASGRAHVADRSGRVPEDPSGLGWERASGTATSEWRPRGNRVGWTDADALYVEPAAAFAAVQQLGRDTGEPLSIGERTLHERLAAAGFLASQETGRGRRLVRRTIEGRKRSVLHLALSTLAGTAPTASSSPAMIPKGPNGRYNIPDRPRLFPSAKPDPDADGRSGPSPEPNKTRPVRGSQAGPFHNSSTATTAGSEAPQTAPATESRRDA